MALTSLSSFYETALEASSGEAREDKINFIG